MHNKVMEKLIQELLEQAVLDGQLLGQRFAQMPLREILAVRTHTLETNTFSNLVDGLLRGCIHPEPRVRFDCAMALDHMADERSTPMLKKLMQDPVPRVRRAAIHAISCDACKISSLFNRDDLIPDLIQIALGDANTKVRFAAIHALTKTCTDARAKPVFELALTMKIDAVFRKNITRALENLV